MESKIKLIGHGMRRLLDQNGWIRQTIPESRQEKNPSPVGSGTVKFYEIRRTVFQ